MGTMGTNKKEDDYWYMNSIFSIVFYLHIQAVDFPLPPILMLCLPATAQHAQQQQVFCHALCGCTGVSARG